MRDSIDVDLYQLGGRVGNWRSGPSGRSLGRVRGFPLRARLAESVAPFPAPATSHAACGFPALRAPAHFATRFRRPICSEPLSKTTVEPAPESGRPLPPSTTPPLPSEAWAQSQVHSAFLLPYSPRLGSCRLLGAFIIRPCLTVVDQDSMCSKAPSLHGRYPASSLLRT